MESGVWRVEGEGSVGGGGEGGPHRVWCGVVWCGVVWYHRLTETGERGAGDSVVLVVALKSRTTQGEGA